MPGKDQKRPTSPTHETEEELTAAPNFRKYVKKYYDSNFHHGLVYLKLKYKSIRETGKSEKI